MVACCIAISITSSSVPEIRSEQFFSLGYSLQSINLRGCGFVDMTNTPGVIRRSGSIIDLNNAEGVRQFQPSGWSAATTLGKQKRETALNPERVYSGKLSSSVVAALQPLGWN